MKKIVTLLITLSLLCTFAETSTSVEVAAADTTTYVYICTGGSSTKYHKTESCRGLNNCKGKIIKITKDDAANKDQRTACKICKP